MIKLQVIRDLCGNYIRFYKGKATKTSDINKASKFTNGRAQEYIDNQVKKSERDSYYIETVSMDKTISKSSTSVKSIQELDCIQIIRNMNIELHKNFSELNTRLKEELKQCDDDILDYRHYMRNSNTILNAVQLCKAAKLCQKLERKREEVKKELARCEMLLNIGDYFQSKAENFNYEEYKPRGNMDFNKVIKG